MRFPTDPFGAALGCGGVSRPSLAAVLSQVDGVAGWLTDDQARRLFERASELGSGARMVEIGSFQGRSTIVLASAAGPEVELIAIDPHAGGDRGPREIAPDRALGDADLEAFVHNLTAAGIIDRVRHVRAPSAEAHAAVDGDIDLLYVDGAHRFGPARADLRGWGSRVSGGGTMLVHDAFSSIGVTAALFSDIVFSPSWRYVGRTGSLAEYRRERLGSVANLKNALRQIGVLPWFLRNIVVKTLLVLGLGSAARLLGHRSTEWPH